MKTKNLLLILLITIMMVMTSCSYDMDLDLDIDGVFKISIDKNFTASSEAEILMNSSALEIIKFAFDPINELKYNFESQGYKTEVYTIGERTGIYAFKNINISGVKDVFSYNLSNIDNSDIDFTTVNTLFYDTYIINGNFNLVDYINLDLNRMISKNILNQVDLSLIVELPIAPDEHNAAYISDDGMSLRWDIIPTKSNHIFMQIKIPNTRNIIFSIVLGNLCLLVLVFYFLRLIKQSK
ncbi:hypothetical protein [Tissierella sp. Yu-01]|uniref:hypothetical protein n=1 Tax=Tissierella sp. Yu-01 TaxID=3035694 RepID=UPI00240DDAAA|nr:hypothetical protein [Tissierella sp. Yu-01]WFA10067.1 hypothetical protein P3962_05795 [Tissierella sp. Yu-01]